jgi:hypothetical protein
LSIWYLPLQPLDILLVRCVFPRLNGAVQGVFLKSPPFFLQILCIFLLPHLFEGSIICINLYTNKGIMNGALNVCIFLVTLFLLFLAHFL